MTASPAFKAFSRRARVILVSDLDWTMVSPGDLSRCCILLPARVPADLNCWLQVDHNDKEHAALTAFKQLWAQHFAKDSLLVFSTGRSHALFRELQACLCYVWLGSYCSGKEPSRPAVQGEVPLGNPDVLVCSVGTEIFLDVQSASPQPVGAWVTKLDQGWDRQRILEAAAQHKQLKLQVRCVEQLNSSLI